MSEANSRNQLIALWCDLEQCECPLSDTRTNLVFGNGNSNADIMFVGEAPGADEDRLGRPFVGRSGKLLDRTLGLIGLTRSDVFVANLLKCRPPGNRDPLPHEIEECKPHLIKQIELVDPKVICTLGNFPTRNLAMVPYGITRIHGTQFDREIAGKNRMFYPMYHPAAALRSSRVRKEFEEDMRHLPSICS